jgi:hypothetical protein
MRAILGRIIGEAEEGAAHGLRRRIAERHIPGRETREPLQPIVGRSVQRHHVQPCLQQSDEGQEQLAVEPVLVEIGRRAIGCRDDHHAMIQQRREQPAHDRGVGHIVDDHLVEAEQFRFGCQRVATGGIGSPFSFTRSRRRRSCTSSMNSWKWTRRLAASSAQSKNRSISMDLPRPTPPHM